MLNVIYMARNPAKRANLLHHSLSIGNFTRNLELKKNCTFYSIMSVRLNTVRKNYTIYGIPELYIGQNLKLPPSTNYIICSLNLANVHISPIHFPRLMFIFCMPNYFYNCCLCNSLYQAFYSLL